MHSIWESVLQACEVPVPRTLLLNRTVPLCGGQNKVLSFHGHGRQELHGVIWLVGIAASAWYWLYCVLLSLS